MEPNTPIPRDEQQRRQCDFDAAIASVRLEGLEVPQEYVREAARFIAGEIEFAELTAAVHRIAATLKPR
ncbi:antitoxin VbhA family protein (plasmid) [Agrobacterium salinitolerans]|uniref:antitoxin VbhA family protein n=1 Tax=Agrobacterium salinitolerans TaxID=1183413 RepID=UPI001C249729|nr:antitoxin VbhA family protein [Agrobacterium salinitolerans]QXC52411.1 antitoxin VbhA family protein [Agrobacterium salinitolerans]